MEPTLVFSSRTTGLRRTNFLPYVVLSACFLAVGVAGRDGMVLALAALMAFGAGIHYLRNRRLIGLAIAGDTVYAWTFRRTITFPLSAVASIEVKRLRPSYAYLHLKQRTEFGDCLLFVPRGTTWGGANPVVDELRARLQTLQLSRAAC